MINLCVDCEYRTFKNKLIRIVDINQDSISVSQNNGVYTLTRDEVLKLVRPVVGSKYTTFTGAELEVIGFRKTASDELVVTYDSNSLYPYNDCSIDMFIHNTTRIIK
ncbi:hypothetical protein BI036_gp213 [Morganella phage vB_MmoM_MP1]|uniref:Uncharacterized protein n=1 Tax=Morganella phage vB_MmoM_MP1 TaxID=1852628 RepID=A0A192YCG1_9CAUD|nr:hypothetical protein BI036_gp213 [Morganella phage vB_MmoM_MP1]ANM46561.1 hypothetical protein MP1_gp0181 [Morganella phage vB_MmoM_MP1]